MFEEQKVACKNGSLMSSDSKSISHAIASFKLWKNPVGSFLAIGRESFLYPYASCCKPCPSKYFVLECNVQEIDRDSCLLLYFCP